MEPESTSENTEAETTLAEDSIAKQQPGLADLAAGAEAVPAGTVMHFPTRAPRLYAGGQSTLKALRGQA